MNSEPVPEVLFVCIHNAGRSQAAAALLDHHAQGRVRVRSAGSAPSKEINAAVRDVLAERGLDISKEFPKPLTDEAAQAADVIITMGCGDECPFYPGKRYLDWELEDPAGQPIERVRPIVDDIDRRVRSLLAELIPSGTEGRSTEGCELGDAPAHASAADTWCTPTTGSPQVRRPGTARPW